MDAMNSSERHLVPLFDSSTVRWLGSGLAWTLLILGGVAPVAVLGYYAAHKSGESLRRAESDRDRATAHVASELLRREFVRAIEEVQSLCASPALVEAASTRNRETVRGLFRTLVDSSAAERLSLVDRNSMIWCDYPGERNATGMEITRTDWYRRVTTAENRESVDVSDVVQSDAPPDGFLVALAQPVQDRNDQWIGTVIAQYRLSELVDWIRDIPVGDEGFALLVDSAGEVVAHPKLDDFGAGSTMAAYKKLDVIQRAVRERTDVAGEYRDPATDRTMVATAVPVALGQRPWVVVAARPLREVEKPAQLVRRQIGVATIILGAAAFAVVAGFGVAGDRARRHNSLLQERIDGFARTENRLRVQTTLLESTLASMADGVVVADEKGRFLSFNPKARQLLGIGPNDEIPADSSRLSGLFQADGCTPISPTHMPVMRAVKGEEVDEVEEFVRASDIPGGGWISISARPLKDKEGVVRGGVSVFRDVTERKRTERRLAAQHATTKVLAESATLNEATPRILEAICESLGWELGAIWREDKSDGTLHCVETWHRPGTDLAEFEALTRRTQFSTGSGLPGRVWRTQQPAWIADVTQDSNFPRAPIAARAGVHGAFGFPILLKDELLGVIEFFSREIRKPDDDILHMMSSIGSQIGQFIERRRAEAALRDSEQRLQSILDNATAVIYAKDRQGRYILINRQFERLFHVTRQQVVGKTDYDFFPQAMADAFTANDRQVLEATRALEFDEVAPQDDGVHAFLSIKFPLSDDAGEPYAVCGISTDITDRKRAEEALKHERYLLHTLMENVPDAIYFKDAESRFIRINRALAEKDGLIDPSQAIGKTDFDFFAGEHAQRAFDDEQRVMHTGQPMVGKEEKETWPDGSVTWVLTTKLPLRDALGNTVGTFGISRDITNRKRAEQALRDSEALYHSLVESLPLNVIRKDAEGRVTFCNSLFCKSMSATLDQLVGKTDHDLFPQSLADKYRRDDEQVMGTGDVLETVEAHETPRGDHLYVHVLKCPVRDAQGEIVGTQVMFWDVTARKRAEDAVQNSERRYRQFTEGSQDAIVVANQEGIITLFNPSAQKTFGYDEAEMLGQPVTRLMPEQFYEAFRAGFARFLKTRDPQVVGRTIEMRGLRKNAEIFPLDISLTALDVPEGVSFLAAIRDTTERHRMQNRVIQAEKMASLGLLSAGVAHEINNPLAFVANNLAVIDRDVKGMKSLLAAYSDARPSIASHAPEHARKIDEIIEEIDLAYLNDHIDRILDSTRQGVKRVADIVQNLRGFARLDQAAVDRVDVHAAIRSSLELIQSRIKRGGITVEEHFGELPLVPCSPAQINQVFLNLLVNATQAIESTRKAAGRITITTRVADENVAIEIADNGCGIPPDVLPKIFDPFFTTKKIGEGTGLGLSITHGIVKDHNGEIEIESTLGEGTCFRVLLPINPGS
jgi:two-component system NtrC family sensor kinase